MSWPKVRLGDVGTLIRGKGIKRSETCATGKPCIRYGEIYTSFNVFLDKPRSFVDDALFDDCPHIKKGDLVLTLTGENKEEIAKTLCYLGDEEIAAGGDLAIWSGHGCDPKYLAYLMYSPAMIKAKADASNGHIVVHASVKKLQDIELPLPPLAEQKKIVEKVEKALKRVDALKAQFERMEKSAADYFKAALAETFAAVKGEKASLEDLCELIVDCPHTTAPDEGVGYPLVRTPNIGFGRLVYENMHRVSKAVYDARNARAVPKANDLVFAREAPAGNIAVIQKGEEVCLGQRTVLLRPKMDIVRPDFLAVVVLSPISQKKLLGKSFGATVQHVNVKDIRRFGVTVPDLKCQDDVVRKVFAAKAKSERMVAAARRGIEICGKMRKAILAEAFQ